MEYYRKCTETWLRYLVQREERNTAFLGDFEEVLGDGLENLSFRFLDTAHFRCLSML